MYHILPGFPGASAVKNPPANAVDMGSISGPGRSPGEGNGNPRQYSYLESLVDRGAWWATVHGSQRVKHDLETKHILKCSPDIDGFNGEFFQIFKKD